MDNKITLVSNIGNISVNSNSTFLLDKKSDSNFIAWYFLPIAMKLGRDLKIEGHGTIKSKVTKSLSDIWASWLPSHFKSIDVIFNNGLQEDNQNKTLNKSLAFYSGGVDSTYSLLKRSHENKTQDLLTVHGMDYKFNNDDRFQKFLSKTNIFANHVSNKRIIVRTDAYDLYQKYNCNPKSGHITHIFALAGSAFLHAGYSKYLIAADYTLAQQFIVSPWGSNSATNPLFRSNVRKLITLDDDIRRSEKLPLITKDDAALASITFCVDKRSRPENCGVCSKCIRTKVMFQAKCGFVPLIFKDLSIPDNWFKLMNLRKQADRVFMSDILDCCNQSVQPTKVPNIAKAYQAYNQSCKFRRRSTDCIKNIFRKV